MNKKLITALVALGLCGGACAAEDSTVIAYGLLDISKECTVTRGSSNYLTETWLDTEVSTVYGAKIHVENFASNAGSWGSSGGGSGGSFEPNVNHLNVIYIDGVELSCISVDEVACEGAEKIVFSIGSLTLLPGTSGLAAFGIPLKRIEKWKAGASHYHIQLRLRYHDAGVISNKYSSAISYKLQLRQGGSVVSSCDSTGVLKGPTQCAILGQDSPWSCN